MPQGGNKGEKNPKKGGKGTKGKPPNQKDWGAPKKKEKGREREKKETYQKVKPNPQRRKTDG